MYGKDSSTLFGIGMENINRTIIITFNFYPISNKFDQLKCAIEENIYIFLMKETKLDSLSQNVFDKQS